MSAGVCRGVPLKSDQNSCADRTRVIACPRFFANRKTNTMKTISVFFVIAGLAAGLQVAAAGDITGTITLKGTPPPEKEIGQIKDDANCGKLHTEAVKTRFFVVGANGGLGDTVVMLKGITGKSTGASAAPLVVDQKGCFYAPYVAACQTGQKIVVRNS